MPRYSVGETEEWYDVYDDVEESIEARFKEFTHARDYADILNAREIEEYDE